MNDSTRSDALVLFGATGDLARKMVLPALYRMAAAGRLNSPVIGVALSDMGTEAFRHHASDAVAAVVDHRDDDDDGVPAAAHAGERGLPRPCDV